MGKKKIFGIVLFLFMTLFMFTFNENTISFTEEIINDNYDDLIPIEPVEEIKIPNKVFKYKVKFESDNNGKLDGKLLYDNILGGIAFNRTGIILPETIANDNYKFLKWDIDFNNLIINDNLVIKAIFIPNNDLNNNNIADEEETYNIVYNLDGNYYNSSLGLYNTTISLLDKPIKKGYKITNWKLNNIELEKSFLMPNNNIQINSESIINQYNLIYNLNEKTIYTEKYYYNEVINLKDNIIKPGYTFTGWDNEISRMPDKDIIVNGKLIPKDDTKYVVNTYFQNLNDKDYTLISSVKNIGTTGSSFMFTPVNIDGFIINNDKTNTKGIINGEGNLELDLYYDRINTFHNEITYLKPYPYQFELNSNLDLSKYFVVTKVYSNGTKEIVLDYTTNIDTSTIKNNATFSIKVNDDVLATINYSVVEDF